VECAPVPVRRPRAEAGVVLTILLAFALLLVSGLLLASYVVSREQSEAIGEMRQQRDLLQQEVRVLTDAIARGNRTPVLRDPAKPQVLEKLDAYWAPREDIVKVSRG
jgi:hypothetical protein